MSACKCVSMIVCAQTGEYNVLRYLIVKKKGSSSVYEMKSSPWIFQTPIPNTSCQSKRTSVSADTSVKGLTSHTLEMPVRTSGCPATN